MSQHACLLAAILVAGLLSACTGGIGGNPGAPPDGTPVGMAGGISPPMEGGDGVDPGRTPTLTCTDADRPSPARLWLLTSVQYGKTVATLFRGRAASNHELASPLGGLTPLRDSGKPVKFSSFAARWTITDERYEELATAADDLSTRYLAEAGPAPCLQPAAALGDCVGKLVRGAGELLYRRPLTDAEVNRAAAAAVAAEPTVGRREAVRLAVRALLLSPHFLFRTEVGASGGGAQRLGPYDIASALSFGLTDGPPDQALWADAQSGKLVEGSVIEQHVARLMAAPERSGILQRFVHELFGYRGAIDNAKPEKFHAPEALVAETDLMVQAIVKNSARKDFFRQLLTSRDGFARGATSTSYGVKVTGGAASPVELQPERVGVLGQPSWMAEFSFPERNDPVRRGHFILERLVCGSVPDAPIEGVEPIPTDKTRTLREKMVAHKKTPSCAACHRAMDGVGLALEGFDQYGRLRETEAGKPIDRSGELLGTGDQDGPFEGLAALANKLAASEHALGCFTMNLFEATMGRAPTDGDGCALTDARRRYGASGGDVVAMLQAFYTSQAFLVRPVASR